MRIVLLTCVLCAVACGGSDNQPAQDPSSVASTTSASSAVPVSPAPADPSAATTPAPATTDSWHPGDPNAAALAPTTGSAPTPANANASAVSAGAMPSSDPGSADHTASADNTKINARDRHDTLTPMNQGNSKDEIKITATIRKGLMSDKGLSFTAKNVKVITVGTKVTLRGPVKTDDEKASIEARARQTSGVTDVDNQLEVKK